MARGGANSPLKKAWGWRPARGPTKTPTANALLAVAARIARQYGRNTVRQYGNVYNAFLATRTAMYRSMD